MDDDVGVFSDEFFRGVPGIGDGTGVDEAELSILSYENGGKRAFRQSFVKFFGLLQFSNINGVAQNSRFSPVLDGSNRL